MALDLHHARAWAALDVARHLDAYVTQFAPARIAAAFVDGARWYPDVADTADDMTHGARGLTRAQSIGTIAALSIRAQWAENERRALLFADGGAPVGVPAARSKCLAIAALDAPDCERLRAVRDVLAGRKISAFMDCIAYPWTARRMPIDVHMVRVMLAGADHMTPALAARPWQILTRRNDAAGDVYGVLETGILEYAAYLGAPAPAVQAALWTLERGAPDGTYRPSLVRDGGAPAGGVQDGGAPAGGVQDGGGHARA